MPGQLQIAVVKASLIFQKRFSDAGSIMAFIVNFLEICLNLILIAVKTKI